MTKMYSIQLSDFYPSATLPQALGSLIGYIFNNETIKSKVQLSKSFWQNESAEDVLKQIKDPDILICSCYVWNWQRTWEIIKGVKQKYPECLVIIGGPEPEYSLSWIRRHPEIDVLIPYYGEECLEQVLVQFLDTKSLSGLKGLITQEYSNTEYLNPIPEKFSSPVVNGYFDQLLEQKHPSTLTVRIVFESNRGCPFSCTFCDIGSSQYTRIRAFDLEVLKKELEWIVKNHIGIVDVADANFGILPRDELIVDELISLKEKYSWEGRFLPTWSKKKGDRVLRIAKKIISNKLDSVFGLSLQSISESVLKNIKRTNAFNLDDLSNIVKEMNAQEVPVYTEVIFPLPGESLESFENGIHRVLDMENVFDKFQVNQLSRYSNTEMARDHYTEKYKLEWVPIKGFTRHYYGENSSDFIAVSSSTINREEVFEGLFYSKCFVIPLYFYGLLRFFCDQLSQDGTYSRSQLLQEVYKKLHKENWFIQFKEIQRNHYMNSIVNGAQFGQILTHDKLDFFPEFSIAHQYYIDSPLYDFLQKHYPKYRDVIQFSKFSVWKNATSDKILEIESEPLRGRWHFFDHREMSDIEYYKELYVSGRFDQRWKCSSIKRIG